MPESEGADMAHDVFISYASPDKPTADGICARLEANGVRCWVAPRDILPGQDWGESIVRAIGESRVLVLVLSADANASAHVKREIERALDKGLALLPFRIQDVRPARSLEYFLSTAHWLDALTPPVEQDIDRLVQAIKHLIGQPASRGAAQPQESPGPPAGSTPTENEWGAELVEKDEMKRHCSKVSAVA
jgi:hypothetical protein